MVGFGAESRVFGDEAAQYFIKQPDNVMGHFTRFLGIQGNDTAIQTELDLGNYPYKLTYDPDRLNFVFELKNQSFSVEEGLGMLLEFAKQLAEKAADGKIRDVAITIPSFFTRAQRRALLSAAEAARLNVLALMNENTAAGFYYSIDRFDNETDHNIILYNIGTSYLQVSLAKLNVAEKKTGKKTSKQLENVEMLSHQWDESLGGLKFDKIIIDHIAEKFIEVHGKDPRTNKKSLARLMKQANIVKKTLSASKNVPVLLNNLLDGKDLSITIEREWFENQVSQYADRIVAPIQRVLEEAQMEATSIHNLEIVGGVSRIPIIQQIIKDRLGLEPVMHLNGDEAMAHGAVIYAANFTSDTQVKQMWLSDISPYEYSVEFKGSSGFSKQTTIFRKGAKLDSQKKIQFTHDEDLECIVYAHYNNPKPVISYQINGISGFATRNQKKPQLLFEFNLDVNGLPSMIQATGTLEIEFKEKWEIKKNAPNTPDHLKGEDWSEWQEDGPHIFEEEDGRRFKYVDKSKNVTDEFQLKSTELEYPLVYSGSEIKKLKDQLDKFRREDEDRKKIAEARNELESYIYYLKEKIDEETFTSVAKQGDVEKFREIIMENQDWIEGDEIKTTNSVKIHEKKRVLMQLVKETLDREEEFINRNQEVEAAFNTMNNLYDKMLQLNVTKTWVEQSEKDAVFDKIEETKKWLKEKVEEQSKLNPSDPPILKIATIKTKVNVIERKVENIKKIQRPKDKKSGKAGGIPDFIKFGDGNMGNIKMDNVVIDGKTYSYDGTQDSEDDDTPTEKPTSHKNEL